MIQTISSIEEFQQKKPKQEAALFYFSHEECNVCKVLKPKIEELLVKNFPAMTMFYVNTKNLPEVAGQERIFAVPTLLVFFDGKEYIRKSRTIGLGELEQEISRYYDMMFGEAQ
ncbi:MAG: thioredoxin family protein [Bacteroidota bacterium]|nr:thioredoxin family protein [Bacteroidota bacterium]